MPDYVVRRLTAVLNRERKAVNGARILLLGLTYKKNTGDVRGSPALRVGELLATFGADIRAADPYAQPDLVPSQFELVPLSAAELATADAVVLLVDHDAFDYSSVAANARYVLDTRRRLPAGPNIERL